MGNPKIVVEHDFLWKIEVFNDLDGHTQNSVDVRRSLFKWVPRYLTIAVEDVGKLKIVKKVSFL